PPEETLGRPLWDVQVQLKPEPALPGEKQHLEQAIRKALRTGEVPTKAWSREMPLRRPDGEIRYVQSLVFAIDTARGHRLCAFSRDVTDRHRAEQALRESETRFRHLVEISSDLIWEVNPDGVYTYVSPSVRDVLGYEPEELLGKTVLDVLPPEDVPRFEALFRSVRDERRILRFLPNRNVRKDGQIVELETNAVPFFDEAGRLAGYRGMDRDVTARKRAEEGLRLLGEVARVLVSSLDYEAVLQEMARLMVPALADWAVVDILVDEEQARPVAVAHVNPQKEELARELQRRYPLDPKKAGYGSVVFRGESILYPEVDLALLQSIAQDEEHLRMNQRMGPRSVIAVPLLGRERPLGALVLLITESARRYGPRDLALAQELGRRAGLAIENARLYRQAQAARGEAERRAAELDGAISAVPDGLIIYGPAGEIVRMNRAAEEILAYTPEERRLPFAERMALLHFETPERKPFPTEDLPMARALRGETVQGAVLLAHREADGQAACYSVSAAPIRDASGRILGAVSTFSDITRVHELQEERERLLAEVQRRAAELDATIDSVADGLLVYNAAGELIRMNRAAQGILGVSPKRGLVGIAAGAQMYGLTRPDGQPVPVEDIPLVRALRGETVRSEVLVLHPPDGRTLWVSSSAAPVCDPDGRLIGAVATFTDITAMRQLQEQREDLLRAVSHDLRNPLAAIQGQAELLLRALEKVGVTGRERQSAEAILKSAQRMNTMIQDLVDAARLEARPLELRREPLDPMQFVEEVKDRLAPTMETARIRVVPVEGLPPVSADPDRLERVLANLFSNALKYSAPGTEVTVTFRREENEVITAVTDRGPGIAPEDMPHLFQRYFRARGRAPDGLGLGLYISRLLIEAHGGRIWAESQVGVGSTFYFSLPVAGEEKPSQA
ncbi:MAG: PAS domain S-box protein, partial [Anaerolineae bacterium]|nr:PAS domain S-box protein [Anaerolineae bacterium]